MRLSPLSIPGDYRRAPNSHHQYANRYQVYGEAYLMPRGEPGKTRTAGQSSAQQMAWAAHKHAKLNVSDVQLVTAVPVAVDKRRTITRNAKVSAERSRKAEPWKKAEAKRVKSRVT
ncbi:hypothetical protein CC80DRAFT_546336 [Byssothecium circinans]|uniref:Uncharacterized protein n=1 Tax=Byssothecium circinans TaxID=147558 RepID=A0A6A5TC22_9PLEO|nr:hypothetical protein CC80DRAFT_556436 [Byssothecium circinans]KAF1959022.1 hypothetical protein CC80DRAFT_546336 [Byssothecium circinans]